MISCWLNTTCQQLGRRRREPRVCCKYSCVFADNKKKKKNGVPPAGRDLSVIFLSEGLTFIEQALPRLTETQSFSFLKKNLQFRLVAALRCYFFFCPPFTRLLSQHGIFSK